MSVFADLNEVRQLGAPVVGLFRTTLARDPDPLELERLAIAVRIRVPLSTLAADLAATPEFARRYAGLSLAERTDAYLCNAFGPDHADLRQMRHAVGWAETDAERLALITDGAMSRRAIPLMPGLVPGAMPDDDVAYRVWVSEYDEPARSSSGTPGATGTDGRLISLLMRAGDTEAEAAERTVASLTAQSHPGWELCLATRTISPWSQQTIEALAQAEPRVRLIDEYGIRAAFAAASGSLIGIVAPGDTLSPDALARIADAFEPPVTLVFTDEDVEDASGRHSPRFKPGFSPDRPGAIGGLAIARRDTLDPISETAPTVRSARPLDPAHIRHVPIVALHRPARPAPDPNDLSTVAAMPPAMPPVTVVVLTKDHPDLLAACTAGILERTDYPALNLLLVDNGTTDPAALDLLSELETRARVRVLRRPGPFNFAALNNEAVRTVAGGALLLLNNDVEVLGPGWLGEMMAHLARPGVGIVGARLLYPDRTIQHAGILLGPGGRATHVGRGAPESASGYLGQLTGVRDFSAVTGACLAIGVETWRQVGGMDERFAVTWNDVDLCLRVRRAGLRVVWTPGATLIHAESTTRGSEAHDPAELARFRHEQSLILADWPDAFDRDPFLNPNLVALDTGHLALTKPRLASRA